MWWHSPLREVWWIKHVCPHVTAITYLVGLHRFAQPLHYNTAIISFLCPWYVTIYNLRTGRRVVNKSRSRQDRHWPIVPTRCSCTCKLLAPALTTPPLPDLLDQNWLQVAVLYSLYYCTRVRASPPVNWACALPYLMTLNCIVWWFWMNLEEREMKAVVTLLHLTTRDFRNWSLH